MCHQVQDAVEGFSRIRGHRERHASAFDHCADQRLWHGDHEAQPRDLVQSEQRRGSGPGPDQRARVYVALRDNAVERRFERQVLFEIFDRLHLRLGGFDRVFIRTHEGLRRLRDASSCLRAAS